MQVVQKVRRKDWHEDLLGGGILGVLKAWLEPVNGCLPLLEVMLQAPFISHRALCSAWKAARDRAVPELDVVLSWCIIRLLYVDDCEVLVSAYRERHVKDSVFGCTDKDGGAEDAAVAAN